MLPPLLSLIGAFCYGSPGEIWSLASGGGALTSSGLCATVLSMPITEGTAVVMQPCVNGSAAQSWWFNSSGSTLTASSARAYCINLAAYGTAPGTQAWLADCATGGCKGNCDWEPSSSVDGSSFANATLTNAGSGLCLQDGSPLPAVLPHTCEAGSPSYGLPFCDPSLPVDQRVADLLSRLDAPTKVLQWAIPIGDFTYSAALNLKAFHWDHSCIHGVNFPNGYSGAGQDAYNVSVFPHAIAQAAAFDVDLVRRLQAATLLESRTLNALIYNASNGTVWTGTSCDGGPLANTAHDARWGRIAECYGEDPTLAATIGVAATQALQNRSADRRWLGAQSTTRHWLGYHGATPDIPNAGEESISVFSFVDLQEPVYKALSVSGEAGGDAEGIMCGYASFSVQGGPMVPSCVHPYLAAKLRGEWGYGGFVQTDCCDSLTAAVDDHHYYDSLGAAVVAFVEAGVSGYFGYNADVLAALSDALSNGTLDGGVFDAAIARTLATRFATGEFDAGRNPDYPYGSSFVVDASVLDGPAHAALGREAVAASLVLLRNEGPLLPLLPQSLGGKTLAVIGPFADCTGNDWPSSSDRDSPLACSYVHTYGGRCGLMSTILASIQQEGVAGNFSVTYAQGSNIVSALPGGLAAAAAAAAAADVVILVVGLGELIEVEGRDRETLLLPEAQAALVAAVAAAPGGGPSKVVLLVVSAGLVDLGDEASAAATIVQGWYGGEQMGAGVADVLFGRVAPSGRLPLTAYRQEYLALCDPIVDFNLVMASGAGRTYRYLNESAAGGGGPGSLVAHWFGYGLSYTSYLYSNLSVSLVSPPPGPGAPDNAPFANVSFLVSNAGAVAAAEIAQVYVAIPGAGSVADPDLGGAPVPKYGLAAFAKVPATALPRGGGAVVTLILPLRAFLATTLDGERVLLPGMYTVSASGHLPDDAEGAVASNVVSLSISVPSNGGGGR